MFGSWEGSELGFDGFDGLVSESVVVAGGPAGLDAVDELVLFLGHYGEV